MSAVAEAVRAVFEPTPKQEEARGLFMGEAPYDMLFGGSRSGKTFITVRQIVVRALKAPGSRHAIFRFRFNAAVVTIAMDTFPKVMAMCFPGHAYRLDKSLWYFEFPNGAQVWIGGLDDKERTEKILGQEHATIYFNECSQIPWSSVQTGLTRLSQVAEIFTRRGPMGKFLRPRAFFDCNPPSKSHWTYRVFVLGVDPETKKPLARPQDWVCFQINPRDNAKNLPAGYIDNTLAGMSERMKRRFLSGEFADANPNALFPEEHIDAWRVQGERVPDMVRIAVGVDPSGSGDEDNADNDEIGIVVGGLGVDGNAYLLEDPSLKAGPKIWGDVATSAWERHAADIIVGEVNFGGAMVNQTIQVARPRTPFKAVTASRGKVVRAEPYSALYEQGKVRHVGYFPELEEELAGFSTHGYTGTGSPNRADAWVWVLAELFPGITMPRKKKRGFLKGFEPLDPSMGMLG